MTYQYAVELHHNFHSSEIIQHKNRFGFLRDQFNLDFQKYLAVSLIVRTGNGDQRIEKIYYHHSQTISSISVYKSVGYNQPELIGEVVPTYEEDGSLYAWTATHNNKMVSRDFMPNEEIRDWTAKQLAVKWLFDLTP